jgi:hypothetical protein
MIAISTLYRFPQYLTRAAYQLATGQQAPAFNPALPVKQWFDPAPNGQPYLVFDTTAGELLTLPLPASVAAAVNLPGTYNFPAFDDEPTDATLNWPYGVSGPINPSTVCLETEAQAIASEIAFLFPGQTVSVVDSSAVGVFYTVYHSDPRRQWGIVVNGVSPSGAGHALYAKALMIQSYVAGVGAPGHFIYTPAPGEPADDPTFQFIQDAQVTTAPAGSLTLPVPISPLPAGEQFVLVAPSDPAFSSAGSVWMIETTPAPVLITLAEVQTLVAQYNAQAGVTPLLVLA